MKELSRKDKRIAFGQICIIYMWFVNLVGSDSYYSVYVLCAIVGAFCMLDNCKQKKARGRTEKTCITFFSALFSLAVILGNYQLFKPVFTVINMFEIVCSFCGGFIIAWNTLICVLNHIPMEGKTSSIISIQTPGVLFGCIMLSITIIDMLYLFCSAYPGILSADSTLTMQQILSDSYNNVMPFWHTMTVKFFVEIGIAIFNNINAAVALFHSAQIIFLAACFAYALVTLHQIRVPKAYIIVLYLIYAFAPYNIAYSVTLWKDVLFGASALLFVTAFYRLLKKVGKNQFLNYVIFVIGGFGLSLWRTNGWYAFALTTFIMMLLLRKEYRRLLWVMVAVLVLCWVLLNPVLEMLEGGKMDLVEALAVPFQQVARYVANEGWMDEYEQAFLEGAFDIAKIKELYDPHVVDPVKFSAFHRDNLDYIKENLLGYFKLYIQFGARRPDIYLEAWVEETKGFWSGGFPDPMYDLGIVENSMGIVKTGGSNIVSSLFDGIFNFLQWTAIFQPLYSIGFHIWIIIGCCLVNSLKKRSEFLLSIPLILLSVGLWLGTPVVAEFRYGYPMILTAPVILAVTLFDIRKT